MSVIELKQWVVSMLETIFCVVCVGIRKMAAGNIQCHMTFVPV